MLDTTIISDLFLFSSALKLLDYFGDGGVYKSAAEHLVTVGGLRYLFPVFAFESLQASPPQLV